LRDVIEHGKNKDTQIKAEVVGGVYQHLAKTVPKKKSRKGHEAKNPITIHQHTAELASGAEFLIGQFETPLSTARDTENWVRAFTTNPKRPFQPNS
jgi:hypothetical protein